MASSVKAKTSGRLGTRLRGKLAEKYGQRNHQKYSLWYVYSPRTNRDWVLEGDLRWDHFVLTESDPRVINVNYAPEPIEIKIEDGQKKEISFEALVTFADNSIELRNVPWSNEGTFSKRTPTDARNNIQNIAANSIGARYVNVTEVELHTNYQKLANWRRVLVWISAVRNRPLAPYITDIAALVHSKKLITLADIKLFCGESSFPLYAAAAFKGVQLGKFSSNLDTDSLSLETSFFASAAES